VITDNSEQMAISDELCKLRDVSQLLLAVSMYDVYVVLSNIIMIQLSANHSSSVFLCTVFMQL